MYRFKAPLKNPEPEINNFLKGNKGKSIAIMPLIPEYNIDDAFPEYIRRRQRSTVK
jgi:hypothetical protein